MREECWPPAAGTSLVRLEVQRAGRLGHPFGGRVDAYGDRANAVDSLDDVGAIADAMRAGKPPDAAGDVVPRQILYGSCRS